MRPTVRRGAWVLLPSLLLLVATNSAASADWLWTGHGAGSPSATLAPELTPGVTPTCTWNSATGAFTVALTWTKSAYALSTVQRTDVAAGTTVTLSNKLVATITSSTDTTVPFTAPNGAGKSSTTTTYTYAVTATAGTFWTRTGTATKAFTLTNAKNSTPDSCA